jgi:hypothetical protein
MNQLSAALNRVRSSLENVNRMLENDARRHHSDRLEEPVTHGHGREPQRETQVGVDLNFSRAMSGMHNLNSPNRNSNGRLQGTK